MIIISLAIIFICYVLIGLLMWIIPFDTTAGYVICGFEDYNLMFIFFWLPALFSERLREAISR